MQKITFDIETWNIKKNTERFQAVHLVAHFKLEE